MAYESVYAAKPVEINYPEINSIRPVTIKTALPKYIKYVFEFLVSISGLACFCALIYGGIMYLTSTGDPGKQKDAISRIQDVFLGAAIVLGAFLISNTINPQLIIPQISIQAVEGIVVYSEHLCESGGGEEKVITRDIPNLGEKEDGTEFIAKSMRFLSRPGDLKIVFYSQENYGGDPDELSSDFQDCFELQFGAPGLPSTIAKSIKFFWQKAGVYLCTENYNIDNVCQGEERYLGADTALLENDFNDKIKAIRLQPSYTTLDWATADANLCTDPVPAGWAGKFWEKEGKGYCTFPTNNFGAVLHEHADFSGQCEIFQSTASKKVFNLASDSNVIGENIASSITIFAEPPLSFTSPTGGVWLCEDVNPQRPISASDNPQKCYGRDPNDPTLGFQKKHEEFVGNIDGDTNDSPNDKISSIIIDGNYLAVLFDGGKTEAYKGKCEVFTKSDSNFRDNAIGRCTCIMGNWGCADCLSSFIIIPTR